jgi:hypothetical protein
MVIIAIPITDTHAQRDIWQGLPFKENVSRHHILLFLRFFFGLLKIRLLFIFSIVVFGHFRQPIHIPPAFLERYVDHEGLNPESPSKLEKTSFTNPINRTTVMLIFALPLCQMPQKNIFKEKEQHYYCCDMNSSTRCVRVVETFKTVTGDTPRMNNMRVLSSQDAVASRAPPPSVTQENVPSFQIALFTSRRYNSFCIVVRLYPLLL